MTPDELASRIDHTLLKPEAVFGDYTQLVRDAIKNKFFSVCVPSFYVNLAKHQVHQSGVKVCSVIGFPFGNSSIESKIEEARQAIKDGADELDIVVNIGAVKSHDFKRVRDELIQVRKVTMGKILKVILETGLLDINDMSSSCNICIETEVDFVKTSTGVNVKLPPSTTSEHVARLKQFVQDTPVQVKASGGIKTLADVRLMLDAGADRIGTSSGVNILEELRGEK